MSTTAACRVYNLIQLALTMYAVELVPIFHLRLLVSRSVERKQWIRSFSGAIKQAVSQFALTRPRHHNY